MKKRGFTLIELLAVIVVLAIIALIATPLVMNTIKNANKGAAERSGEGYLKQIETRVMEGKISGSRLEDGIYKVTSDGKLCAGLSADCAEQIEIDVKGNKPTEGIISISNGLAGSIGLIINGEKVGYDYGDEVYYNVKDGVKCQQSDYRESNSATGYKGNMANGTTVSENCLKFYVAGATGNRINLLLDHNTTATEYWTNSSTSTNRNGPIELIAQLASDTTGWIAESPSEYIGTGAYGSKYTIAYMTNARLISAEEIAKITEYPNWNQSNYYFDSNTTTPKATCKGGNTSECGYGWLYDRTSTGCTRYGCKNNDSEMTGYGYWTNTAFSGHSLNAWGVAESGFLNNNGISSGTMYGVRPVIEVLRSNL